MSTAAARKAQNHGALKDKAASNGAFDLDAWQKEAQREPFAFILGGQRFELPHLQDLDWRYILGDDGEPGEPGDQTVHKWLRKGLGGQWETFAGVGLTTGGYRELWRRWQKHSGIDPGESPASPPS